jgi:hypothetical protein
MNNFLTLLDKIYPLNSIIGKGGSAYFTGPTINYTVTLTN